MPHPLLLNLSSFIYLTSNNVHYKFIVSDQVVNILPSSCFYNFNKNLTFTYLITNLQIRIWLDQVFIFYLHIHIFIAIRWSVFLLLKVYLSHPYKITIQVNVFFKHLSYFLKYLSSILLILAVMTLYSIILFLLLARLCCLTSWNFISTI